MARSCWPPFSRAASASAPDSAYSAVRMCGFVRQQTCVRPPSLCAEMPGVRDGLPPFVSSQPREETA